MKIMEWHLPNETPDCPEGEMIAVILQRNGKVFGGWYLNKVELIDEYDSLDGVNDEDGLSTGFADRLPHSDFSDYYEFAALYDLECWAYMPAANEAALGGGK